MKKIILFFSFLIVVVGAFLYFREVNAPGSNTIFCSSEGTLTDKMPIQSHRSYCLKSGNSSKHYSANAPNEYSFSVVDDQGDTLKKYEITHTKPMHVIVVRKDLQYFQHLHPEFDKATGIFTLRDLIFPADGEYRIFADFATHGSQTDHMGMPLEVTIQEDVFAGNRENYKPEIIGSEEKTKTFDGYQVTLETHGMAGGESMLMFSISQGGKPVTGLQEYLGALGHSVILRDGTLDFIHVHPMGSQMGTVDFMVSFPEAGKYKAFTQFRHNDKVITTDFVINIK